MDEFILKNLSGDITEELNKIGFDNNYIHKANLKFQYKNIKIFNLTSTQANILKQTALSVGADCATHREVITGKIEKSDCILGGSISQLEKISEKLKLQPFNLKILGEKIKENICFNLKPFSIKNRVFDFSRPYIAGVLNLGESFSDGYTTIDSAKKQFEKLVSDGADIIDIGAESTRPGASEVKDDIQLEKILPILEFAKDFPVSIDTRSSEVAKICLENGADIINDVSGFDFDEKMPDIIAKYNCPVIIQHSTGTPDVMQNKTEYSDVMDDIFKVLYRKVRNAKSLGIDNIIVDAGIGFGKTREQNIEILKRFEEFYTLNTPIMLGISRKSFLNMQNEDNFTKDIYTLAIDAILINKKINFVRVHNVALHKKLLDSKIL